MVKLMTKACMHQVLGSLETVIIFMESLIICTLCIVFSLVARGMKDLAERVRSTPRAAAI